MWIFLVLSACQEPFAEDRHDLAGFRIAAVQARGGTQGSVDLRAFVYSGLGMWHVAVPDVTWTSGDATATGPVAQLPFVAPGEIRLTATDGVSTESAVLALDGEAVPPTVESWSRGTVDLTIADVAVPIADRDAVPVGADVPVEPGGALRLALDVREAATTTHWMSTGGDFAELDASRTDWFAGTAVLDDDVVDTTEDLGEGVQSVVALTFDGRGGATWLTLDTAVAVLGPRLLVGGRVFPVDASPGEGWFAFTVEARDDVAGIALVDVVPVDTPDGGEAACGVPAATSFDFAALAEGWCARDDLVGARLVAWGEVVP